MKKSTIKLNFLYVSLILVLAIIYLITIKFGSHDDIVKYLGFGLTITSLFVGLIAIFQAFFSGNSLNKTAGVLDNSARNIQSVASEVKVIITDLQAKVEQIPRQIDDLGTKMSLTQLKADFDNKQVLENTDITTEQAVTFLNNSSTNGVLSLYIVAFAFETKKSFDLNEIFKIDEPISVFYLLGYIIAARSLGIIKMNNLNDVITITDCIIKLEAIEPVFQKKTERAAFTKYSLFYSTVLENIRGYFDLI